MNANDKAEKCDKTEKCDTTDKLCNDIDINLI